MKLDVYSTLRYGLTLLLAGCCLWIRLACAEPISINDRFSYANLGPSLELLAENNTPLTLQQVRQTHSWRQSTRAVPSFGFTPTAYWFRINLFNSSADDLNLLLALTYPALDHIEFYQLYGDKIVSQTVTGDAGDFVQRPLSHRNFLFPIQVRERHQTVIYLRVKTTGALQLPIGLYQPQFYFLDDQHTLLQYGGYYGLMLAVILYNLFLFISSRDRVYGFFVLYVVGFGLTQLTLSGLAFQYLWPDFHYWNQLALPWCIAFSTLFACCFTHRLLQLHSYFYLHRWFIGLGAMALVIACATPWLPFVWSVKLSLTLVLVAGLSLIALSGRLWYKQQLSGSLLFNLAWVAFLVGIIIFALDRFGVIPRNPVTEAAIQIGAMIKILLLSYALAARLTQEYKGRLEAEFSARTSNQKFFQAEQQHALALEQAVQEKTAALHDALCQVSKLNLELARISITDSLTGLYNRRHFDKLLDTEMRRAAREERPISLILIDADHFKTVNDTYGHHVGDECLRQLANIIISPLRKPPDLAFRYGGEEIALLLPGTDALGAEVVAEKIRTLVEEAEFKFADTVIKLTLSLGIACVKPGQELPHADLFDQADKALYRAKNLGRNRVEQAPSEPNT